MSQNESTTFLVTDAKNLTLIDANRENSPWCCKLIPAIRDSTVRQRDRANCALYQFDRSVTDRKLMIRDPEKNGDQHH